jgi:epoxyqueuosine reductase
MKMEVVHTQMVKQLSRSLGFDFCGIAEAVQLTDDARRLESWLSKGYNGKMGYMANHFDKRIDPRKLVDGAKSVITLLMNYYPGDEIAMGPFKIARYAFGDDYHDVIRAKLRTLLQLLSDQVGPVYGRGFVDSAPVLERAWAVRSGLGWVGKNGNLIRKGSGSYFFIATLIVDLPLVPDDAITTDYCGSCTRCIDACPTQAILPGKEIQANQCISYYTIELKEAFNEQVPPWNDWMFGCDICQEVCPWNRFSVQHQTTAFDIKAPLLTLKENEWRVLSIDQFASFFKNSALNRTGYQNLMRNMKHIS